MEYILGIDLGTTNTCVYYTKENGSLELLSIEHKNLLPSVVSFRDSNVLIGQSALNQLIINPLSTVYAFKRLIGRRWDSVFLQKAVKNYSYKIAKYDDFSVRVNIDGELYSIEEISALLLGKIKQEASKQLGVDVIKCIITVPAYFNENQRKTTRDAGRIAGFDVLNIINEPTAAALAYGFKEGKNQYLLVYDLGGGTFDVTVLNIVDDVFEVIATVGDTFLGGEDFTNMLVEWIKNDIIERYDEDFVLYEDPVIHQRIKNTAESIKKDLSLLSAARIEMPFLFITKNKKIINYVAEIERDLFNKLVEPLVDKTIKLIEQMLDYTDLTKSNIDKIILVGGQTRSPIVVDKLEKFFETKISSLIHPDEAVAIGAAIKGRLLSRKEEDSSLLLDVISQSMGIMVSNGFYERIIDRDSIIPCSFVRSFTTVKDNQEEVDIHIFQGESSSAKENTYLGTIKIKDIPPLPQGEFKIDVKFLVDSEGILTVEAIDVSSGKSYKLILEGMSGLSEEELKNITSRLNLLKPNEDEIKSLRNSVELAKKMISDVIESPKNKSSFFSKIEKYQKYIEVIESMDNFSFEELKEFIEGLTGIISELKVMINE